MKIKLTFKNIIFGISTLIILILISAFSILSISNKKPVAAFYGIPASTQKNIEAILQTTHTRKNTKSLPYEIITLNHDLPLSAALKKSKSVDLLFINDGLQADEAAKIAEKRKSGFDKNILFGMSSTTIKASKIGKKRINAIPVLTNHYEIDVKIDDFKNSKVKNVNYFSDLEMVANKLKSKDYSPVLFAAGDDYTMINIVGALTEALSGKDAWKSAVNKIIEFNKTNKSNDYGKLISELTEKDGEFFEAISLLESWKNQKLFPKNISVFLNSDVNVYMNMNKSSIVFMSLSEHRECNIDTISNYTSIYYPFKEKYKERSLTGPVIFAVPLTNNKISKKSISLFANHLQTNLATKTGLAPVQKNCGTPDKQSDDARFWIAASEEVLPTLSDAAFTTKNQRHKFAEELRSFIK